MKLIDTLKGKTVKVMTDAKVEVELTVEKIEESHHSEDVGPSTPENDWWPEQREWTTFEITFTNGYKKSYHSISDIQLSDTTH